MNKQKLINMVSAARGTPICRAARLKAVGQHPKNEIAYCPFPTDDAAALLKAFRAAPQFARIDAEDVLRRAQHGVRAILISESPYDARQAALYLSAMSARLERDESRDGADDADDGSDLLAELDLDGLFDTDPEEREMKNALLALSASLLDPDIASAGQDEKAVVIMGEQKRVDLSSLPAPALLVYADSGPALSSTVIERLEFLCDKGRDVFVSLRKNQVDLERINDLMLKHQFLLLNVLPTTDEYLSNVLRAAISEQRLSLASDANLIDVVAHLRRLRGKRFDETDLYDVAAYAAQHTQKHSLTTADLLYHPYSPKGSRRALDELSAMTGLENVKTTLRRQLAVSVLNTRRDRDMVPCRHLAFAGSPGTGKSVTARLVAEILREEGCGTGRFVEVGREQLVGKYVGHTSPKIAKLFEQARGGVLFIDEAGALIPDRSDSYAEEAVNALVRHMELDPETVVIFATYSDEMKQLLDSNPGLSSRIARVLEFDDYTDEQLWSILGSLTAKEGFALPSDAHDSCLAFFHSLRKRKGKSFGNGREARRLRDAAIEELALRAMDGAEPVELTAADFDAAARCLLEQESEGEGKLHIGF